eukprot:5752933-Amphidinium_carterae.1
MLWYDSLRGSWDGTGPEALAVQHDIVRKLAGGAAQFDPAREPWNVSRLRLVRSHVGHLFIILSERREGTLNLVTVLA